MEERVVLRVYFCKEKEKKRMKKALTKGSLESRGGLWCMNSGKGRNHKKCFPKPDGLCLDGTLKRRETGTLQPAE